MELADALYDQSGKLRKRRPMRVRMAISVFGIDQNTPFWMSLNLSLFSSLVLWI
jgi:hypothetical protein